MTVKYAILGILAESARHGYDLKRTFDEKIGFFWSLNVGQIYTTLNRLEVDGLVAPTGKESHGGDEDGRGKRVYAITPTGQTALGEWLTRPQKPEPRALRDELFVKLLFMDPANPQAIFDLIQRQKSIYLSHLMHLTDHKFQVEQQARQGLAQEMDTQRRGRIEHERLISSTIVDAAIFHTEADIRWLDHCLARLQAGNRKQ